MSVPAARPRLREVLASPKMLAILALGAASGFPNQITESALQAWFTDSGISITLIGVMSYVALPYLFKPLWAPLVDRYTLPFLGRRRGWMLAMQLALVAGIAGLALLDPRAGLAPIFAFAFAITVFSATQDIAIDAWRADIALPQERALAATVTNLGYRGASWLAVAVALLLAEYVGWRPAFLTLAAAMLLFCVATVRAPSTHNLYQPRTLAESVIAPLRELLAGPGALALLLVILLFKVGDAFSNKLFTPFMMYTGFSKPEIAFIIKALFTASSLGGSVLGGLLIVRLGLVRSMLAFGVLQALSNLLYCWLALVGKNWGVMAAAVVIEHVAAAMGGIALIALIMALCDQRYSAFQYALLSAIATLPRYLLGGPAGLVAAHGWFGYFVTSFVLALPGLAAVWFNRRRIATLDVRAPAPVPAVAAGHSPQSAAPEAR